MSDAVQDLLVDTFNRVCELVFDLTDGLNDEAGAFRPDPGANSVAWLLWHLTRVQDDHVADLAAADQAWPAWRERFGLPFDDFATGYGQTADDVGKVRVSGELLAGYHSDVHERTLEYIGRVDETELARVVDTRWDPPVTASVRLVSVLGDLLQHLGQAAYVRGLFERRTAGWQSSEVADR